MFIVQNLATPTTISDISQTSVIKQQERRPKPLKRINLKLSHSKTYQLEYYTKQTERDKECLKRTIRIAKQFHEEKYNYFKQFKCFVRGQGFQVHFGAEEERHGAKFFHPFLPTWLSLWCDYMYVIKMFERKSNWLICFVSTSWPLHTKCGEHLKEVSCIRGSESVCMLVNLETDRPRFDCVFK